MIGDKNNLIENQIEDENNNEVIIDVPFNPNDIKVTTQPLTLGDLVDRLEHEEICLNSDFQRMPNLWDDKKKSRLIESVLLRLPIPTFYFDGRDDNRWEVIDGLQRISTLKSFMIDKTLILKDLEFLKEYDGYSYEKLPRELQRRIKTFPITVYILEKGTPDDVKYNIFSRLNQGGLVLNPQEIRNALHQGVAADLVADLARGKDVTLSDGTIKRATKEGEAFVKATCGIIKTDRMEDRDFVTRFISFYLVDYKLYVPDMDTFMSKGMRRIESLSPEGIRSLKLDFVKSMNTAWSIFENDAFRKRGNFSEPRKPINKALFDVLSVCFAKLSKDDCQKLIVRKEKFRTKFMELNNDPRFIRSISQGTALKENVIFRFWEIGGIINETIV